MMLTSSINTTDIHKTIHSHFSDVKELTKTKNNIIKYCIRDVLDNFCYRLDSNSNNIILDTRYFKFISSSENYPFIISYIISIISEVLKTHDTVIFHSNMQNVTLLQIDKHLDFIKQIAERMMREFPDKLETCYIYNMPYLFSALFNIISCFIDKKTLKKLKMVE
jgi:CRAL/TRIO domain